MHMADALISPAVAATMWGTTAGITGYSLKRLNFDVEENKLPLMGVMGAFVFAAQMVNFAIPGTGSSGHLGGGLLLAILLGPYAGFLTMATILFIQALFFADGGLLAFGCNVFNLGFYTCFVAYPLYKRMIEKGKGIWSASVIAAVIGLQLGAFSVVVETVLSGKTELPFTTFTLLMQPIHLAIGIVEGIVTAAVVTFIAKARPELVNIHHSHHPKANRVLVALALVALFIGGIVSSFASSNPDGLEWSIAKTAGTEELEASTLIHETAAKWQEKLAPLPDYNFKNASEAGGLINIGTSFSGVFGTLLVLFFILTVGTMWKWFKFKRAR
ncbi:energy-coupling factor ABC transporter permease [Thermolongibacillus altinsuensis]|uniref:energy-coupling factor ABC transporter permease n=1 Tax=Thermolongibacillus altinsuensis TaxID=575256 RepID=UPI00242A30DF|nr:energy-coupling factor ABC transporter permease [Thermolongibacillus altinsuensis]GMB09157.1 cobalamin biosynthesis protein CbiM [Thermolongibacillus altinsuensis]